MGIENSMMETRNDLKEILKGVATLPEMQRMLVHHDKRIGVLEQKAQIHDLTASRLDDHLKQDEPTDQYVNRNIATWVKKGLWVATTGLIGWLVAKLTGK
jgi:hypothetical protein